MARLGELLVGAGLLTSEHLERALRAQVMWGARLGTNLVELGLIDLDVLTTHLGRLHNLPAALARHFEKVDKELQLLLSADLAEMYCCVPLMRTGPRRDIVLAASSPLAKKALGRIADDLAVEPEQLIVSIAAELRVRYQLERIYNIPRPARFMRAPGERVTPFPQFETFPVPEDSAVDIVLDTPAVPKAVEEDEHTIPLWSTPLREGDPPIAPPPPPGPAKMTDAPVTSRTTTAPRTSGRSTISPVAPVAITPSDEDGLVEPKAPAIPLTRSMRPSVTPVAMDAQTASAIAPAARAPVAPPGPPAPPAPAAPGAKPAKLPVGSEPDARPPPEVRTPSRASTAPFAAPPPPAPPPARPSTAPSQSSPAPAAASPAAAAPPAAASTAAAAPPAAASPRAATPAAASQPSTAPSQSSPAPAAPSAAAPSAAATPAAASTAPSQPSPAPVAASPAAASLRAATPAAASQPSTAPAAAPPAAAAPSAAAPSAAAALRADTEVDDDLAIEVALDEHKASGPYPELDDLPADIAPEAAVPRAVEQETSSGRERRKYVRTLDAQDPERALARIAIRRVAVTPPSGISEPVVGGKTLGETTRAIRRATDRDRVAELSMDALFRFAPSCHAATLMVLRGQIATSWKGFCRSGAPHPELAVPLDQPGLVPRVAHRNQTARAPASDLGPIDQLLLVSLGHKEGELIVVPISIGGEVMCVIAMVTETDAATSTPESIAAAAGAAFARLMRDASR